MDKLRAIIIDDEARSRESLRQKIVLNCSDVEIIAECENGEQGIQSIEEGQVFIDAIKNIAKGEEIYVSYGKEYWDVINIIIS